MLISIIVLIFQSAQADVVPTATFNSNEIESITIQTDNDLSFHSKLELIDSAKDSIKMIYFIYNNDYTSSFITKKLIEAAERGVKVEILLDYMTNYSRLDFYSMVENQARLRSKKAGTKGKIEFRFYNRPSKSMILTAGLITTGCGSKLVSKDSRYDCSNAKLKN